MRLKSEITTVDRSPLSVNEFSRLIGTTIGVSSWYQIGQNEIDAFANLTDDNQYIHVDVERAKAGPFGGTIAHGMLSLSLISTMFFEVAPPLEGSAMVVNYGFEKVRFISPVPSGAKISGSFSLDAIEEREAGQLLFRYTVTISTTSAAKPAVHAEWIILHVLA